MMFMRTIAKMFYFSLQQILLADGGYAHSVAMASDGSVYAWGCGTYGQIGNGDIVKVTNPMRVALPGPATHLAAGYFQNVSSVTISYFYPRFVVLHYGTYIIRFSVRSGRDKL